MRTGWGKSVQKMVEQSPTDQPPGKPGNREGGSALYSRLSLKKRETPLQRTFQGPGKDPPRNPAENWRISNRRSSSNQNHKKGGELKGVGRESNGSEGPLGISQKLRQQLACSTRPPSIQPYILPGRGGGGLIFLKHTLRRRGGCF